MTQYLPNIATWIRGATAAVLLCAAAAAPGQTASDADLCANITAKPDAAIQHCTKAIDSKRYSGEQLSRLYYNRGLDFAVKGILDRAIADFDAAIRVAPKFADSYFSRGNAWSSKGDSDRAIADFESALRLNPKDTAALGARAYEWAIKGDYARALADYDAVIGLDAKSATAYFGRGRARFYAGDITTSITDLQQAMKLEPNAYTALWLYLARKRAGIAGEELLEQGTADIRGSSWPWPIVVLIMGRTDVASVMAAATDSDAAKQREQRCEAHFYMAHWHLLRNDRDRALPLLKEAQSGCPRDIMEYEGAVAELRRLQAR